ncbi:hypothetical protein Poly59_20810 [Rubripirellula reticaptiva]|uniref:Uncharacterized protein n=1 Tax=Rubripirellula reticaptiva TaxID=2528013 RepID=A0A5C6F7N8_9BACT|nr:hypothetical protein Poly59_20810 [Rubripirellula reticaptiva]
MLLGKPSPHGLEVKAIYRSGKRQRLHHEAPITKTFTVLPTAKPTKMAELPRIATQQLNPVYFT